MTDPSARRTAAAVRARAIAALRGRLKRAKGKAVRNGQ